MAAERAIEEVHEAEISVEEDQISMAGRLSLVETVEEVIDPVVARHRRHQAEYEAQLEALTQKPGMENTAKFLLWATRSINAGDGPIVIARS